MRGIEEPSGGKEPGGGWEEALPHGGGLRVVHIWTAVRRHDRGVNPLRTDEERSEYAA